MTTDLPSQAGTKFEIQIATITIPYISVDQVRFCRFLARDQSMEVGALQAHIYAKFGDARDRWLGAPSIVQSDLETFDYPKLPMNFNVEVHDKLKERSKSFVRFAAEENKDTFIFDFVLSAEMTKDIKANCKSQKLMQIFNVSFDNTLQIDPTLSVSKVAAGIPDILFRSEYAGFIAYGLIEDYFAVTIENYEEQTCHDPIMQYANSIYYDPALRGHIDDGEDFEGYLEHIRKRVNSHFC